MRRDLIGEHQRKYGLLPSVKRQERQARRLERAPRMGDSYVTRLTMGGGMGPPGPPGSGGGGGGGSPEANLLAWLSLG
jgi:hypothetical protein